MAYHKVKEGDQKNRIMKSIESTEGGIFLNSKTGYQEFFVTIYNGEIDIEAIFDGMREKVYFYHVFLLMIWKSKDGVKKTHIFYQKGRRPTFDGEAMNMLHFKKGEYVTIEADSYTDHIVFDDILRLSFFAMTDRGVLLVSFYPSLKDFARPLVMFVSKKPSAITLAQHFGASWMLEIYKKK